VINVEDLKQNGSIKRQTTMYTFSNNPCPLVNTHRHTLEGGAHISMSVSVSRAASLVAGCLQCFNPTWHSPKYLFPLAEFTAKEVHSHIHIKCSFKRKFKAPKEPKDQPTINISWTNVMQVS